MSDLPLDVLDTDGLPQSGDRLQILSPEGYDLLWGFPRFTQSDRDLFFTLAARERKALERRRSVRTKIHFPLHLGFFRARQRFFRFDLAAVRNDTDYLWSAPQALCQHHSLVQIFDGLGEIPQPDVRLGYAPTGQVELTNDSLL